VVGAGMARTAARNGSESAGVAPGRRRAAGIYGAIVTAAILAAAGGQVRTSVLAVAVVVTLMVYWVAEEYAELLGRQAERGTTPTRRRIRAELVATWPMVSASYGPLLALLLARVCGAPDSIAADIGLVAAILLLVGHAWSAGRAANLRGRNLIVTTSAAAALGVVMVVLKDVVLVHLH
jgi:hypothetical protein